MSQSVDAMLGIINNANQTNTIIDAQRNIAENQRSANERGMTAMINTLVGENNKTDNLINMQNQFANQNLASLGSSLKDMINTNGSSSLTAIERNGAMNVNAIDRNTSLLSHSLERIGGDNINATERNGSMNLVASERIGNSLANLLNQNNNLLNTGIKDGMINSEKNFGETRLFNSTQNQILERRIGDYHLQTERNFHGINNDLLKVENSLGRLADNHHNTSMIELLKVHSALEKGIDRSEMSITRQAADNYANIQIEAAKNRLGLEQKISDIGNDIKLSIIKDNNETRNLINSYNNDNIRNDLQSERIIHALHHHHPYHHQHHHPHHHHGNYGYDNYHHHNYPPFFPILQMGGGAVGVSGGVSQGQSSHN
jgi:hypothetical protein